MPGSNHLRDNDIPYRTVQLVNDDGRLDPPAPLTHIITSIDPKTHFVELVSEDPQPIVKIKKQKSRNMINKRTGRENREAAASNIQKEIQMT